MNQTQLLLFEVSRFGIGIFFLIAAMLDIKTRSLLFELMLQKKIPNPWLFFTGAVTWKMLTSLCLIFNVGTFWAALLLALYIFLASCVFMNFWSAAKEQRDVQLLGFITNVAISFGLLAVAAGYY